jgi:2-acylglycerol O-acyltransferase 2
MSKCCPYFSFKIEFEDYKAVEKAGPSIFCIEPHSVLPVSIYWGSLNVLANHKMLACLSSSILTVPIMKHILTWTGAVSADRATMVKHLSQGYSLNICPGGVQEVGYLGDPTECVLFIRSRYGVTRMALTQGCPLIPSMTFGLHKAYDFWAPAMATAMEKGKGKGKDGSDNNNSINDMNGWLKALGRKLGFFPLIFFGLGGVPFAQAKPCPLVVVVGAPIVMPQIDNPSAEVIQMYHQIFVDEMERLYEDNKWANGMGEITLRII